MIKTNHAFHAEFCDEVLRVGLEGEIDHHSAVATRGEIDRLIYENRPKRLDLWTAGGGGGSGGVMRWGAISAVKWP